MIQDAPVDPLDLLAWADGRLDDDPAERARIEALIAADPETAARARAWRAQTDALRAAYAPVAAAPPPARLAAIVERPWRGAGRRRAAPVAAALALLALGALGGWGLGARQDDRAALEDRFIARSLEDFSAHPEPGPDPEGVGMDWLADRISLTLRAPDLMALGYRLSDVATIRGGDGPVARLTYADRDGEAFALFLRPRWERRAEPIAIAERDGIVMAHWRDGPLTTALATRLPRRDAETLAGSVRAALAEAFRSDGGMQATAPRSRAAGVEAGAASAPAVPSERARPPG